MCNSKLFTLFFFCLFVDEKFIYRKMFGAAVLWVCYHYRQLIRICSSYGVFLQNTYVRAGFPIVQMRLKKVDRHIGLTEFFHHQPEFNEPSVSQ